MRERGGRGERERRRIPEFALALLGVRVRRNMLESGIVVTNKIETLKAIETPKVSTRRRRERGWVYPDISYSAEKEIFVVVMSPASMSETKPQRKRFRAFQPQNLAALQWRQNEFESGGTGTGPARSAGNFLGSCPSTFLALKVQLVVLVSAFVMVSTVWSVSCLLFFYSRCPRAQPFVKVRARAPRAPWSRRHCILRRPVRVF